MIIESCAITQTGVQNVPIITTREAAYQHCHKSKEQANPQYRVIITALNPLSFSMAVLALLRHNNT